MSPNIIMMFSEDISIYSNSSTVLDSKLSAIACLILFVVALNLIRSFLFALSSSELLESSNLLGGVLPAFIASSLSLSLYSFLISLIFLLVSLDFGAILNTLSNLSPFFL